MIDIKFEKEKNRFVAYDNKTEIGECVFIEEGEYWNIVHTEVSRLYQGQGIAKKLVENVVENAKRRDKTIIAECSYAKKIIERKHLQ